MRDHEYSDFKSASFNVTFTNVTKRRRTIEGNGSAVDPGGEDEDDIPPSIKVKGKGGGPGNSGEFNVHVGPIFSRKENGISHNNLSSDRGPRALEAVYKNIAAMYLTVTMGLPGSQDTESELINNGFTDEIIKEGTRYCLESTSIEGCKTGGDFLQVVQEKIMGMLFSITQEVDGTYSVENFGFISFDRIATIIGAIFKVPSIFMSGKATNVCYGGLNIRSTGENMSLAYARRNPALMPRMSIFERAQDCYWLHPNDPHLRCERLHSILIAVIDLLYKDSGPLLKIGQTFQTMN